MIPSCYVRCRGHRGWLYSDAGAMRHPLSAGPTACPFNRTGQATCISACFTLPSHTDHGKMVLALNFNRDDCFTVAPENILVSKGADGTASLPR